MKKGKPDARFHTRKANFPVRNAVCLLSMRRDEKKRVKKGCPKGKLLWERVFQYLYCFNLFLDCQTSQGQFVELDLCIYISVYISTYLSKMRPPFWSHQMDILGEAK